MLKKQMMLRLAIKTLTLMLALAGLALLATEALRGLSGQSSLDSLSSYLLVFGSAFCFTASAFVLYLIEESGE